MNEHELRVRFEVLTGVTMKITVLWNMTPCSFVDRYQLSLRPEHGGNSFLRNVFTSQKTPIFID
jgi:hypothetical protein